MGNWDLIKRTPPILSFRREAPFQTNKQTKDGAGAEEAAGGDGCGVDAAGGELAEAGKDVEGVGADISGGKNGFKRSTETVQALPFPFNNTNVLSLLCSTL